MAPSPWPPPICASISLSAVWFTFKLRNPPPCWPDPRCGVRPPRCGLAAPEPFARAARGLVAGLAGGGCRGCAAVRLRRRLRCATAGQPCNSRLKSSGGATSLASQSRRTGAKAIISTWMTHVAGREAVEFIPPRLVSGRHHFAVALDSRNGSSRNGAPEGAHHSRLLQTRPGRRLLGRQASSQQ